MDPALSLQPGWRIAAPSWVIPDSIAANAMFLEGKVAEVGICFFDTKASLAYTSADLPIWLGCLDLDWHAHLPLDLPWDDGADRAASICIALYRKISWLNPAKFVLHPPKNSKNRKKSLADFMRIWKKSTKASILLENTEYCDIASLGRDFLDSCGYLFCLDVGHALGYSQHRLLDSDLPKTAILAHWSAPGDGDRHCSLAGFTGKQKADATVIMRMLNPDITHMLEIFDWEKISQSMAVLAAIRETAFEKGAVK